MKKISRPTVIAIELRVVFYHQWTAHSNFCEHYGIACSWS